MGSLADAQAEREREDRYFADLSPASLSVLIKKEVRMLPLPTHGDWQRADRISRMVNVLRHKAEAQP